MRIDVTYNELSGSTCVFVYEWRQTVPQANLYTQTHILMGGVTPQPPSSWSVVEPGALPESLPSTRVHPPTVWCTIPMPPLFSYFLSSFSVSLSLINVKPFNNKAGILSLPAFSVLPICHCAMTLPPAPTQQPPSSFLMAAGTPAHTANIKRWSETV